VRNCGNCLFRSKRIYTHYLYVCSKKSNVDTFPEFDSTDYITLVALENEACGDWVRRRGGIVGVQLEMCFIGKEVLDHGTCKQRLKHIVNITGRLMRRQGMLLLTLLSGCWNMAAGSRMFLS